MALEDELAAVVGQEGTLVFPSFDEETAFAIGSAIRERAAAEALPIVVDIRFWDRPLFYAALPGSKPDNVEWVRRKANLVRRLYKSSYRVVLEYRGTEFRFARNAMDEADYVLAGGGFPIRILGVGVVGAIIVSGLPERDDHELVVWAIARALGIEHAKVSLRRE